MKGGGQLLPNWMKLCYTVFSLGGTNPAKRSMGNKQIFQYGRFNSSYFCLPARSRFRSYSMPNCPAAMQYTTCPSLGCTFCLRPYPTSNFLAQT